MHCYLFTIQILWVHITNVFFQVINDERAKTHREIGKIRFAAKTSNPKEGLGETEPDTSTPMTEHCAATSGG